MHFQLILQAALSGAGVLTLVAQQTSLEASVYIHLAGHVTHVTVDLSKATSMQQPSGAGTGSRTAATGRAAPSVVSAEHSILTTPVPLAYGAAIQLQQLPMLGTTMAVPYYAVSEEVLMKLTDKGASMAYASFRTPFDGSLQGALGLLSQDSFVCPAIAASAKLQDQGKIAKAITSPMPHQQDGFAWLPWVLCLCLLLCNAGLMVFRSGQKSASPHDTQTAIACNQEASYVDSSQQLITPTKDTGCSPFVPVQLVPAVNLPYGHGHLASCSSKIGSYKAPKPTTSKAVTNMTSNVSGCTKWQRSKNGRLLSHIDPNEFSS